MSRFARRAGKRDAIEPFIVGLLRHRGYLVMQLDTFDLLAFKHGEFWIVEVKSGEKPKLTRHQEKLVADGWPLVVIRSVEEAEEMFP